MAIYFEQDAVIHGLAMASSAAPASAAAVTMTIRETVLGLWSDFIERLPFLAAAVVFLLLTALVVAVATRVVSRILKRSDLRQSLQSLILRFVTIIIWVAGWLLAAMIVFPGLTPTKALGAMGIASVAVGFAFKDIFENFLAGVLMLWQFPFENGDFITCQDVTGQVEDVSIRMTKIRLVSGELVVMPNSVLFKNPVEVLTSRDKRRVSIVSGIAYGENVSEAVDVIKSAVNECQTVHKSDAVQIFPQAFGSSSVDIEVAWWTNPLPVDIRRSRGEVVTAIKSALDEAGIEIPFPYRTLTFKQPLQTEISGHIGRADDSRKKAVNEQDERT